MPRRPGAPVLAAGLITTNTYVGADWWGTIVFKNTGVAAMTSPTISFGVPSGIVCVYDEPGWTHTQRGRTCTYARQRQAL